LYWSTHQVYDEDFGRDDPMGKLKIKLDDEGLQVGEEKQFNEKLERTHKGMFSRDARIFLKVTFTE
jgi:hypothetical protein